jgi:predicted amidohydrolase
MVRYLYIRASVLALFLRGLDAMFRAQDLAITNATVYSPPDAAARRGVTVLIRHGVIAEVEEPSQIPKGVKTISCQGCFVFAGFWNAHVHSWNRSGMTRRISRRKNWRAR